MKFFPLIWAGLWRKPTRTFFTFLSIVVAFVLFGVLAGINIGFSEIIEASRLNRLYVDRRYGTQMPRSYLEQIKAVPGVKAIGPSISVGGFWQEKQNNVNMTAAKEDWFAVRDEVVITPEQIKRLMTTRTGAIPTAYYAKRYGWKVGDVVPVQSTVARKDGANVWAFEILDIIPDDNNPQKANHFFINYDYVDETRAKDIGTIGRFTVVIDDPNRAGEIGTTIDRLFANSQSATRTASERAGAQSGLQSLGDTNFLVNAVGGAVLFMLLFLTGNSMMQSVRERIPEFGVMKVLGFTDLGVLLTVLAESAISFTAAGFLGLFLAKAFIMLINNSPNPPPPLLVPWSAVAIGVAFSVVAAVLSALIPALRVKRLSPIDALAGK